VGSEQPTTTGRRHYDRPVLYPNRNEFVFLRVVFGWQWRYTIYFLGTGLLVAVGHELGHIKQLELPTLPLAVVGAALSIFVSFRTNAAYDRWWEGRKLWGKLINQSRHFASQAVAYVRDAPTQRDLVRRHVAYVHVLRCALRGQTPLEDDEVAAMLDDDLDELAAESNLNHALLHKQLVTLDRLNRQGDLDDLRLQSMDQTLRELIDIQGGCERILKTPMPPLYGLLANRLVLFYGLMFPLAVTKELGWWMLPVNLLVCTAFSLIAEAGRVLENPFTLFFNGLPLSAISRMIEVNVRQRLGETDLPPMLEPSEQGVLM
jgi:ion channel-forming bestrophin family protein